MKVFRIIQVIGFVIVLAYLVLLHQANDYINLPFVIPAPPAIVIGLALFLGFIWGWIPGRIGVWRRRQEIRKLNKRIRELEQHLPTYAKSNKDEKEPIIPDRTGFYTETGQENVS